VMVLMTFVWTDAAESDGGSDRVQR